MRDFPLAYFITFHTYGTWLHGDDRGSVDPDHNVVGHPFVERNTARERFEQRRQEQAPLAIDDRARRIVDATIRDACTHRRWTLHALHVRTNHIHVVVTGQAKPEAMMNTFKAWATRRLSEAGIVERGRRVWSRHGSTRYLWDTEALQGACDYVLNRQGVALD